MPVALVYGSVAKHLRRVYVADTLQALARAVVLQQGEDRILLTDAAYAKLDAPGLHAYLATQVGVPVGSGRAVELDATNTVVAAYQADPEVDRPIRAALNTLLAHDEADIGDQRDAQTGRFPALDTRNRTALQSLLSFWQTFLASHPGADGSAIIARVQGRIDDGTVTLAQARTLVQQVGLDPSLLTAAS
jgi:hypothetical protein